MNPDNLGGPDTIGLVIYSRKFEFDPDSIGKPLEVL